MCVCVFMCKNAFVCIKFCQKKRKINVFFPQISSIYDFIACVNYTFFKVVLCVNRQIGGEKTVFELK